MAQAQTIANVANDAASRRPAAQAPGQQSAKDALGHRLRLLHAARGDLGALPSQPRAPAAPTAASAPDLPPGPGTAPTPDDQTRRFAASASLSAAERLRQSSLSSQRLAPFQRARVLSDEAHPLTQGGPGAPLGYPGVDLWPCDDIPPGSRYTQAQWQAARQDDAGRQFAVVELQTSQSTCLIQIPIAPAAPPQTVVVHKDGKPVVTTVRAAAPESGNPLAHWMSALFSDCLLAAETSWPEFPGAAEQKFVHNASTFRVIRPRADYIDPARMWRAGAQWTGSGPPPDQERLSPEAPR